MSGHNHTQTNACLQTETHPHPHDFVNETGFKRKLKERDMMWKDPEFSSLFFIIIGIIDQRQVSLRCHLYRLAQYIVHHTESAIHFFFFFMASRCVVISYGWEMEYRESAEIGPSM